MLKATGVFCYYHSTRHHLPVLARVIENDRPDFIKILACVCGVWSVALPRSLSLWFLGTQQ